jgi:hypothetical protein
LTKPLSTVASVGITFIVTLVLNTLLNYYSSDRGTIGVSRSVPIDGKTFTVVTIENYSRDFLDGIAIEIPSDVSTPSLFSDTPITVTDAPHSHKAATRIVKVGQVSPRLVTRIFIPSSTTQPSGLVRIANTEASGVSFRRDDELESPLKKALVPALVIATLYAIFAFASTYLARRETKDARDDLDRMKKEIDAIRTKMDVASGNLAKQRILLQARLFDYSKELSFWRNAVKALLLDSGASKKTSEAILRKVTETLGTHGTSEPADGFSSIRIAAGWLAEIERNGTATEKKPSGTAED